MNKAEQSLQFLHHLQALLDDGDFSSTYKFALLHALADLSVEKTPERDGTLCLHSSDIADKFIAYYWRQARPFGSRKTGAVLSQNSAKQAAVVNHLIGVMDGVGSYDAFRSDAKLYEKARKEVARVIREMPLPRLQKLRGNRGKNFLYDLPRAGGMSWSIRLKSGVADSFSELHGLILNMIRGAWVRQIQVFKANQPLLGKDSQLLSFMFGSMRSSLSAYVGILHDHQDGHCFYCDKRMNKRGEVDHFVPWSRYPTDLAHNFVLAHSDCNGRKSDHLAAVEHLVHWRESNLDEGEKLSEAFVDKGLFHDQETSRQVAWWAYQSVEKSRGLVWKAGRDMEYLRSDWRSILTG